MLLKFCALSKILTRDHQTIKQVSYPLFACGHVSRGVKFQNKNQNDSPRTVLLESLMIPYAHILLCSDKTNLPIDMYVDLIYMKVERLYLVLNGASLQRPRCFDWKNGMKCPSWIMQIFLNIRMSFR